MIASPKTKRTPQCPRCGGDLEGLPGDSHHSCPHCKIFVLAFSEERMVRLANVLLAGRRASRV